MNRRGSLSRSAARRGMTMIETLTTVSVASMVMLTMITMVSFTGRTTDKRVRENAFSNNGRAILDEMLREIRVGKQIIAQRNFGTRAVTTNGSNLVLEAPGFDPASQQGILPGVYDLCTFYFDPHTKTLRQTTEVGSGSKRALRADLVLARNVESLTFTFRAREAFKPAAAENSFPLSAPVTSAGTATVFLNGVRQTSGCSVSNGESGKGILTFNSTVAAGTDVQVQYAIDPTRDNGRHLAYATTVTITMTLAEANASGRVSLSGTARLRNSRI